MLESFEILYLHVLQSVMKFFLLFFFFSQRRLGDAAKKAISKLQVRTIKKGDEVRDEGGTRHSAFTPFFYLWFALRFRRPSRTLTTAPCASRVTGPTTSSGYYRAGEGR